MGLRAIQDVSIPKRVWAGLELAGMQIGAGISWFQSLRGFGLGWSLRVAHSVS